MPSSSLHSSDRIENRAILIVDVRQAKYVMVVEQTRILDTEVTQQLRESESLQSFASRKIERSVLHSMTSRLIA